MGCPQTDSKSETLIRTVKLKTKYCTEPSRAYRDGTRNSKRSSVQFGGRRTNFGVDNGSVATGQT